MEVFCERCRTQYEFEDAKVSEAGVTVRCTVCSHVFLVKRPSFGVGERPTLSAASAAGPLIPPPAAKEWRVFKAGGKLLSCRDLATLQKWIVERTVARDDEISLNGEPWKRLGDIAELASFFRLVEDADRGLVSRAPPPPSRGQPVSRVSGERGPSDLISAPARTPPARVGVAVGAPVALSPHAADPARASGTGIERTAAWEGGAKSAPAWRAAPGQFGGAPSFPDKIEPEEMEFVRGPRKARAFVFAALGVGLACAAFFVLRPRIGLSKIASPISPAADGPASPAPALPPGPALAEAKRDALGESSALGAGAKPPEPAGAPGAPQPTPAAPTSPAPTAKAVASAEAAPEGAAAVAGAKVPQPGAGPAGEPPAVAGSFDSYIRQGFQLRDRGQPQAAFQMYEKAETLNPQSAEPPTGKGFCLLDLGRVDAAVGQFKEALRRNSRFQDASLGLAEAYKQLGDTARAVENYQRYLDQAPDGPEASLARSNIERLNKE